MFTQHHRALLAIGASLMLVSLVAVGVQGQSRKSNDNIRVAGDTEKAKLAKIEDSDEAQEELRCAACHVCVGEARHALYALHPLFLGPNGDRPGEIPLAEAVDALDKVLEKEVPRYGIIIDDETGYPYWVKKGVKHPKFRDQKDLMSGAWITQMAKNICASVMGEYEDHFPGDYRKVDEMTLRNKYCHGPPLRFCKQAHPDPRAPPKPTDYVKGTSADQDLTGGIDEL